MVFESKTRRDFLIASSLLGAQTFAAKSSWASGLAKRAMPTAKTILNTAQLDAIVDGAVSNASTPGIALCIWHNGAEIYSRYHGAANLETNTPVGADSVFRVGSLTKQFAGALILKLVALGKLALIDPAHKFLPFLANAAPFSVLELLNHTAGVRDSDDDGAGAASQIALAQRIAKQQPLFDFAPGTAWLYSNANYILIGAIIEKVTGMALATAAKIYLFAPLALHSCAFDTPTELVKQRVNGYSSTEVASAPFQNADYLNVALAGAAGAMRANALALCRWHDALFQTQAFAPDLTAKMILPGRLRTGELASSKRFSANDALMGDTQYGLGLMLDRATKDQSLIVNHHGGINGFAAYLATHLEPRARGYATLSFACLCNIDTHPGLPFRELRRSVFAAHIK